MYNLVIDFIMCNFARFWICSCLYGNINNSESVMKHLKNKTNTVWMISHKCIVRLSSVKCIDKEYQSFDEHRPTQKCVAKDYIVIQYVS